MILFLFNFILQIEDTDENINRSRKIANNNN